MCNVQLRGSGSSRSCKLRRVTCSSDEKGPAVGTRVSQQDHVPPDHMTSSLLHVNNTQELPKEKSASYGFYSTWPGVRGGALTFPVDE